MNKTDIWDPKYASRSAIFHDLAEVDHYFSNFTDWPSIEDYKQIFNQLKTPVTPVPQAEAVTTFEEQYEQRVYLKGELQTRTENWHDFFNALVWLRFPETKKALNHLHYQQSLNRPKGSNRTTLENRITQFDECGAVIISDEEALLELVRNHQWKTLFIENRKAFSTSLKCIVFGHAIYEKALNPYIGMTCHCILLNSKDISATANIADYQAIDHYIAEHWLKVLSNAPKRLSPYPLLGAPGLWPDQSERFYNNKNYFR